MSLFEALWRSGALRTLDHALAQSLRRLDALDGGAATPDLVLAGTALASLAVGHGHAGFDPARPQLLVDDESNGGRFDWPPAAEWHAALAGSRWISTPDSTASAPTDAPLVLESGLLYLRRYREYEHRLAQRLRRIAAQPPPGAGSDALAPLFALLFPDAGPGPSIDPAAIDATVEATSMDSTSINATSIDHQARAAALALRRSLLLVTGGPGTGKTTTITRLLVLLVAQARHAGQPAPRIALAAPTGRAAERMAESLRQALAVMGAIPGIDPALLEALPTGASTLHRLLGTIPDSPRFRHDADHPLPFEVVVVDEASMVDLPLMCKLAEAVADGARLILLGDPDQLPSVEAGDVLAAIVQASNSATTPLAGHRVHLRRGYRQAGTFELAPLAAAVREGDATTTLALLRGGDLAGVHFHESRLDPLDGAEGDALLTHWRALADAPDPLTALTQAGRVRLLAALRDGPQGARGLNARIEEALAGRQRGHVAGYFPGRLLLITENSYRHQLFNGDVGVCLPDANGTPVAWFPGSGDVRSFHPAALPAHESAFAMTVHKAQGSEFDTVWLQLPRNDGRGLSRELLYTALTRARRQLHLCASEAVLRGALGRHAARVSGLGERLRGHGSGGAA